MSASTQPDATRDDCTQEAAESSLARQLQLSLETRYGRLVSGEALWTELGYPSVDAMRQAQRRGYLEVPVFRFPRRRGMYALAADVAQCLARARCSVTKKRGNDVT